MSNPFFSALQLDQTLSSNLDNQANQALMPFIHYLENSITALKEKEVSCKWRPLSNQRYQIKPIEKIWLFTPISHIEVQLQEQGWFEIVRVDGERPNDTFDPDESEPLRLGKGKSAQKFELNPEDIQFNSNYQLFLPDLVLDDTQAIHWSGYELELRPLSVSLDGISSVHIDSQNCRVLDLSNQTLTLEGQVTTQSRLSIQGQEMSFRLVSGVSEAELSPWQAKTDGANWLLFSNNKPNLKQGQIKEVTSKKLSDITLSHYQLDGSALQPDHWQLKNSENNLELTALTNKKLTDKDQIQCARFPEISWQLVPITEEEKWIQLVEDSQSADQGGKSELDYFFEEDQNLKILDSNQEKSDDGYRILKPRPEERQLLLARNTRNKKSWQSELPTDGTGKRSIRVSVDTSQLHRQKEAINQLMRRPSKSHAPLIKLLQNRETVFWECIDEYQEAIDWQVLTNGDFDGCDRQREFVKKALASPDFSILDGPPGTGKTTTILELIMQMVLQGKRVLLTASTHAAINNVLERIKENNVLSNAIFPLRVGNENNATGVENYQYDTLLSSLREESDCDDLSTQLMVDASNLVCGTTIGILKLFREKDLILDRGEPPFDMMIIDECSKTTFQEFLVPARFAKRWVLVGDIRQLSPFTDRDQIVANLNNLMLRPKRGNTPAETLSKSIQQACFLLEVFRGNPSKNDEPYQHPMLIPVSKGVLSALDKELQARKALTDLADGLDNILLIFNNQSTSVDDLIEMPWILYSHPLIFAEEVCLERLQPNLPDDVIVMHPDWMRTAQAFESEAAKIKVKPFKAKNQEHTTLPEIYQAQQTLWTSSQWSEEVCWRLERDYWLRLSKNHHRKTAYLTETLNRLFPKSVNADGRIHILKNIAFPSILEALSGDGLQKRRKDDPTTLNQGFEAYEKNPRYTTLTYQHRMHPDIASFPRKQFYPPNVLLDGGKTTLARKWGYDRYAQRNVWLDVRGHTQRNANLDEAKVIIEELKQFCEWASTHPKSSDEQYDIAVLTFYKGQEKALREALQKLPNNQKRHARFNHKGISIKLATVDYFQGQEADVVFLSMVNTHRDGFMDSPNRLNVSITRARYQMIIVGHHYYFSERSRTEELKQLAKAYPSIPSTPSNRKGVQSRFGKK